MQKTTGLARWYELCTVPVLVRMVNPLLASGIEHALVWLGCELSMCASFFFPFFLSFFCFLFFFYVIIADKSSDKTVRAVPNLMCSIRVLTFGKECIYFGNSSGWGHGAGKGPWIMADLENGLWAGDQRAMPMAPLTFEYVTAMVKGDSANHWSIKGGDATQGMLYLQRTCSVWCG